MAAKNKVRGSVSNLEQATTSVNERILKVSVCCKLQYCLTPSTQSSVLPSRSRFKATSSGKYLYLTCIHRIIMDRMENGIKGSRILHCSFAASIYKVQRLCQY